MSVPASGGAPFFSVAVNSVLEHFTDTELLE